MHHVPAEHLPVPYEIRQLQQPEYHHSCVAVERVHMQHRSIAAQIRISVAGRPVSRQAASRVCPAAINIRTIPENSGMANMFYLFDEGGQEFQNPSQLIFTEMTIRREQRKHVHKMIVDSIILG